MKDQLDKLLDYCKINARVFPHKWHELWEIISEPPLQITLPLEESDNYKWIMRAGAPPPLILGGAHASNDLKRERLKEQIIYAMYIGMLDKVDKFLRGLPEDEWHHEMEI